MILTAEDTALLLEALDDGRSMRISTGLGRIVMTAGPIETIDADADAARAYRRLHDEIEAAGAPVCLDGGTARLAADALDDGAAYVGGLMLLFGVRCPCCTGRSVEYQSLRDDITAALDRGRM